MELGDRWMWGERQRRGCSKDDVWVSGPETQVNGEVRDSGGGGSGFEG